MGAGRIGGLATDATGAPGSATGIHGAEVLDGQTVARVGIGESGGLAEHVADAVVAVVNDAVITRGLAGEIERILGAGEAVEVVVLEELCVAARVAFRDARTWTVVCDGFNVGDAVEVRDCDSQWKRVCETG